MLATWTHVQPFFWTALHMLLVFLALGRGRRMARRRQQLNELMPQQALQALGSEQGELQNCRHNLVATELSM